MSQDEITRLADALRELRPTAVPLDRDRLMYEAGLACRPTGWQWPFATAVSLLATATMAVILVLRPGPRIVNVNAPAPVLIRPAPAPQQPMVSPTPDPASLMTTAEPVWPDIPLHRLEDQVLRWGLDGLPPTPPAPPPQRRTLQEFYQAN
jgi:hypothetical protein